MNMTKMGRPARKVGDPKKRRKSRLDAHAEQLELWLLTMDYRAAAKRAKEQLGVDIHWTNLRRWHVARTQHVALHALQKGDTVIAVTRELIERKLGQQLAEFESQYDAAVKDGDMEAQALWSARWQQAAAILARHFIPKQPDVLVQQAVKVEVRGNEIREWAKGVLDGRDSEGAR